MSTSSYSIQELMAVIISREIADGENINVGTLSPLPAAGCWLAQESHAPGISLCILGSPEWPYTDGTAEFFDVIQRGDCDLFFLSGAQIDRKANLNLHVIGSYYSPRVRLPGGAGSGMIYYMAGRTILFMTRHTPDKLTEKVDFITTPGTRVPGVFRHGYPSILVTPLCVMRYDKNKEELVLESIHPGVTEENVKSSTGWPIVTAGVKVTEEPTETELCLLRTKVKEKMLKLYPEFAKKYIGNAL